MTVFESLQGINAYPVPTRSLVTMLTKRGLTPEETVTQDTLEDMRFNLARADVLFWLSMAPNVSQGGQSYSFTEEQRSRLRQEAMDLYGQWEPESDVNKSIYGYKGDTL